MTDTEILDYLQLRTSQARIPFDVQIGTVYFCARPTEDLRMAIRAGIENDRDRTVRGIARSLKS